MNEQREIIYSEYAVCWTARACGYDLQHDHGIRGEYSGIVSCHEVDAEEDSLAWM